MDLNQVAKSAKIASVKLAAVSSEQKNKALEEIIKALRSKITDIVAANKTDLLNSENNNLSAPLLKRLKFDEKKISNVIDLSRVC